MSAHTRRHHTEGALNKILFVLDDEVVYAIPKSVAQKYIVDAKAAVEKPANVSADIVFAELDKKHGKASALLKGVRARENLSQVQFAKKIGVTQANLSKMENGTRPIGKAIAKRIQKAFSVDYRYFLE